MYRNYADKDFFKYGCMVDDEHGDTVFDLLLCRPCDGEEDLYQFGDCEVDISDDWIDRKAVMDSMGMTEETFDPVWYAIGCTGYYAWDNFGAASCSYDWMYMTREKICEILKNRTISPENLDMTWLSPTEEKTEQEAVDHKDLVFAFTCTAEGCRKGPCCMVCKKKKGTQECGCDLTKSFKDAQDAFENCIYAGEKINDF